MDDDRLIIEGRKIGCSEGVPLRTFAFPVLETTPLGCAERAVASHFGVDVGAYVRVHDHLGPVPPGIKLAEIVRVAVEAALAATSSADG